MTVSCEVIKQASVQKQKVALRDISVAISLPKNVHTGRLVTLFAQHKSFMAPTIREICIAKLKGVITLNQLAVAVYKTMYTSGSLYHSTYFSNFE